MKFSRVLPLIFSEFDKRRIDFALVGGLALYFSGAARTTFGADFLILLTQFDDVDEIMKASGYRCIHKSDDAANYISSDPDFGQVDFLLAHRKYALAMMQRAGRKEVLGCSVKVLKPEDLIGLKIQSSSNDPQQVPRDMADIEALIARNAGTLDWDLVRDYFKLFNRESELDAIKKTIQ
jgi:hypothetical protein